MAGTTIAIGEVRPLSDQLTASRRQGRYVLGDLLGRGGMAEVFAGSSLGSHGFEKPVAVKRLLPALANDHVFVDRLIDEAKLLVGMQHGNIVSVLDLAREGNDVFLVMEYVDGPTLRQLLKARGKRGLPLGIATYIVQAAAAGLEFAHARPGGAVIHADISPSNLLLTTSGEVRVADFGIARREGNGTGIVEGKWAYMAPEQARGEALTPRSDVFALGVVLYELITGRHPLGQNISPEERDSGPIRIVPPRVVSSSVPAGLEAICMRALADDACDRYARMQQLIDALVDERFANGWREGASDLAQAIREAQAPAARTAAITQPDTVIADRPVTIVTRSLISEPSITLSTRTSIDMPILPHVEGTPLPAPLPLNPELGSVHGEQTLAATVDVEVHDPRGNQRAFAVLGIAALLGGIAAFAIQRAPAARVEQAPRTQSASTAQPIVSAPEPVAAPPPAPPTFPEEVAAVPEPTGERVIARKSRPAPVAKRAPVTDAVLRVTTHEGVWAWAYVGKQRQDVPGAKFKLTAGSHVVKLRNTDLDLTRTCRVKLESGQVRTVKVDMEAGGCEVY